MDLFGRKRLDQERERLLARLEGEIADLRAQLRDRDRFYGKSVARLERERQALQNRLLLREGVEPVHKENGVTVNRPVTQKIEDPHQAWQIEQARVELKEWHAELLALRAAADEDPEAFADTYEARRDEYETAKGQYIQELGSGVVQ